MAELAELRAIVAWVHNTKQRDPDLHIEIMLTEMGVVFCLVHKTGCADDYLVSWDELAWARFPFDMVTNRLAERIQSVLEDARCVAAPGHNIA